MLLWLRMRGGRSRNVALLLLEYIYTDNLAVPLTPFSPVVRDLLAAAREYEVRPPMRGQGEGRGDALDWRRCGACRSSARCC